MRLASSHYEIDFSIDSAILERVIFPISSTEQKGIEDARFVKLTDEEGVATYYATYTANDGVFIKTNMGSYYLAFSQFASICMPYAVI